MLSNMRVYFFALLATGSVYAAGLDGTFTGAIVRFGDPQFSRVVLKTTGDKLSERGEALHWRAVARQYGGDFVWPKQADRDGGGKRRGRQRTDSGAGRA